MKRARSGPDPHRDTTSYNQPVYFVYMVRCADGTLYTGFARDPIARLKVHNAGKGAKYTRSRRPVALVYSEACESLSAALKRERELKPWSKARKEALVAAACSAPTPLPEATPPHRRTTGKS